MATYTEKLGLKLPAQTDFYNIDDFNENFRKIDGLAVLRGTTAPTTATVGIIGQFYFDTGAKMLYQCVSAEGGVYEWFNITLDSSIGLSPDVATALGLTGNPQVKDALMRTVELFVTAEMINRSSIATVLVGYGITQTVSANYKIAHTTPTTFTLLGTKEFSLTGIGGFSRRLKITWAESPGSNTNMFEVYYKIKLSDGTIYTTSAINPYMNGAKGIEIDIVQPEKNNLSATVDVYGRCANTSTGWKGDITLTTLTLAADKMAYID